MGKPSKLVRLLRYRNMKKGQSTLIIVVGPKGVGKSWLGLALGLAVNLKFDSTYCVYNSIQFHELLDKGIKPGSVVLYDELGVAANSRDAQTRTNKSLSSVAQTIRPYAITVIFTTIYSGLIDNQVKNLMDYMIEVLEHDEEGRTKFKFFRIKPRRDNPKPLLTNLIFGGVKYWIWTANKPPAWLAGEYDKRRKEYGELINRDALATGRTGHMYKFGVDMTSSLIQPKRKLSEIGDEVMKDKKKYYVNGKPLNAKIGDEFGLGGERLRSVLQYIRAKSAMRVA